MTGISYDNKSAEEKLETSEFMGHEPHIKSVSQSDGDPHSVSIRFG